MKQLLFLTNIPAPYKTALFNELGKYTNLTVLYERKSASNRNVQWNTLSRQNYTEIFLNGISVTAETAFCIKIGNYLTKTYDFIIVGGYSTPTGMLAILKLYCKKIPFLISADGGFIKNDTPFKKAVKTFFISKASAWFSSGDTTTGYLMHYGAKKKHIYNYPFTSVMEKDITAKADPVRQNELRKKLGINEPQMVLSVGSYIYRKGYDVLIKAMKQLPKDIGVYIVGGKPTEEYQTLKNTYQLKNLHFIDFKKKDELAEYYQAADLFVLPTREDIWGLVINEAMAFGLPVITTNRCIAGLELIENKKNGFIIENEHADELAEKIMEILTCPELCKEMSQNNIQQIQNYTIEKMAARYLEVLDQLSSQ